MAKGIRNVFIESDSVGVLGTKIYRDGILIATVPVGTAFYEDPTAIEGVEYKYVNQAYTSTSESTDEVEGVNMDYYTIGAETTLTPIMTNFRVEDATPNQVHFDTPLGSVNGILLDDFDIFGKTIIAVDTTNNYFTVSEDFDFWNQGLAIRKDIGTVVYPFTLERIDNQITEPSASNNKFVTHDASGGGNGTEGSPWTFTESVSNAVAGDTVWMKAGNYGDIHISINNDGTPTNPIKWIGYKTDWTNGGDITSNYYDYGVAMSSDEMPTFTGVSLSSGTYSWYFSGASNLIFKNIQFTQKQNGIQGYNAGSNFVFERINFDTLSNEENAGAGFVFVGDGNGNTGARISDCRIVNAATNGIHWDCDYGVLIEDTKVYNDRTADGARTDYGIVVKGNSNVITNCYVESFNHTSTSTSSHGIGTRVISTHTSERTLIEKCTAINWQETFYVRNTGANYNVIKNCYSGNNGNTSSNDVGALMILGEADYNIFENCTVEDVQVGIYFTDKQAEDSNPNYNIGTGNRFRNCIFSGITNNCINMNGTADLGGPDPESLLADTHIENCTFNDSTNLLYSHPTVTVDVQGFYFTNCVFNDVVSAGDATSIDFTFNYNNFFGGFTALGTNTQTVDPNFTASYVPQNDMYAPRIDGVYYDMDGTERADPTTLGAKLSPSEEAGSQPPTGDTYYVSNSGNDTTGDGSISNPYATIDKVNSLPLASGDVISFNKDDQFYGLLSLSNKSNITINSYGNGTLKPIITTVKDQINTYTDLGGDLWVSDNSFTGTYPLRVMVDGEEVMGNTAALTDIGTFVPDLVTWWYDLEGTSANPYRLYIQSTINPGNKLIEFSQESNAVILTSCTNITIDGIEIIGGRAAALKIDSCSGFEVLNCDIGDMAIHGVHIDVASTNIDIHSNEINSKYLLNFSEIGTYSGATSSGTYDGINIKNGTGCNVYNNNFTNWSHTSVKVDSNDNKVFDNTMTLLSNLDYGGALTMETSGAYGNEAYGNTLTRTKESQINGYNNNIHHNTFSGQIKSFAKDGYGGMGVIMQNYDGTCNNNIIENNTFINTEGPAVRIDNNNFGGDNYEHVIRYNDIDNCGLEQSNYGVQIRVSSGGASYGHTITYNDIYSSLSTNTVQYDGITMDVATFNTQDSNQNIINNNTATM